MLMSSRRVIIKKKTILTELIKFQLVIMIVYEGWYLQKFSTIPKMLQLLAATIIGTTALLIVKNVRCGKNTLIKYWLLFGIYSFLAALIVNANKTVVFEALFTYFSFIAVVFCAGAVSKYTSDYSWFSRSVLFVSAISAYFALFHGVPYQNGAYFVTTMSDHNNPNNLGLMMSIGTFMAVFPEQRPRLHSWIVRIALLLAFLWVTINTGSRSSLLCEIAVILLFLYSRFKKTNGSAIERLLKSLSVLAVALVLLTIVMNFVSEGNVAASAIRRLIDEFNVDSFSGRADLYVSAWTMYKEHPICGIGYNCFATLSGYGYFTHSTYMELLACTGTIGFLLFLGPVFAAAWRSLRVFKYDSGRAATILALMLVSGFFGIVYYNMVFLMVLYMEISRIPRRGID